jgi:hypothetical protein
MRLFGLALMWCGLAGLALAFAFPVTAAPDPSAAHDALMAAIRGEASLTLPDNIANLDLLAQRAMLHSSAGYAAIVGAILFGFGSIGQTKAAAGRKPGGGYETDPGFGQF